jgi:hypothetical protein
LLRETDGEQFCYRKQKADFANEFARRWIEVLVTENYLPLLSGRHEIVYVYKREKFKFRKNAVRDRACAQTKMSAQWTTKSRNSCCKIFSDNYNANPSLEAIDCPGRKLKVDSLN